MDSFLPVPSDAVSHIPVTFYRAVTGQPSADNRKSDFLVNELLEHGLSLSRSRRETHLHRGKFVQRTRASPGINFSRYIIIY